MGKLLVLENKYITSHGQLGIPYNQDDGIGISGADTEYELHVKNCIVDLSNVPVKEQDEAAAVTRGASAIFQNCLLRGTGKLFLIGGGDLAYKPLEQNKTVVLNNCILEDFCRRGPEVQCEMICELNDCLVRNWFEPNQFTVRGFAAWAHDKGKIYARNTIFLAPNIHNIPLRQRILDRLNHVGQAFRDERIKAFFDKKNYIPGYRRALIETDTGHVEATNCWFSPNCYTDSNENPMDNQEMISRIDKLEEMKRELLKKLS